MVPMRPFVMEPARVDHPVCMFCMEDFPPPALVIIFPCDDNHVACPECFLAFIEHGHRVNHQYRCPACRVELGPPFVPPVPQHREEEEEVPLFEEGDWEDEDFPEVVEEEPRIQLGPPPPPIPQGPENRPYEESFSCVDVAVLLLAYLHRLDHEQCILPGRSMTYTQINLYLENLGVSVPIYTAVPGLEPVLIHRSGSHRLDGVALVYFPKHDIEVVSYGDWPLLQAHWALLGGVHPPTLVNQKIITIGPFPLSYTNYWHATVDTPLFRRQQQLGLACMCSVRGCVPCNHSRGFSQDSLLVTLDPNLAAQFGALVAQVDKILSPSLSLVGGDGLSLRLDGQNYRSQFGHNTSQYFKMDVDFVPMQIQTGLGTFDVYKLYRPRFRSWKLALGTSMAVQAFLTAISVRYTPRIRVNYNPLSNYTSRIYSTLPKFTIRDCFSHMMPRVSRAIGRAFEYLELETDIGTKQYDLRRPVSNLYNLLVYPVSSILDKVVEGHLFITRPELFTPRYNLWAIAKNSCCLMGVTAGVFLSVYLWRLNRVERTTTRPQYDMNNLTQNLTIRTSPVIRDIISRLAFRRNPHRNELRTLMMRMAHRAHYGQAHPSNELEWFETAFSSEPGSAPVHVLPAGTCINCMEKKPVRKLICCPCIQLIKNPHVWLDPTWWAMERVGTIPLVSTDPIIPRGLIEAPIRKIEYKGEEIETQWRSYEDPDRRITTMKWRSRTGPVKLWKLSDVLKLYDDEKIEPTTKGKLCGPMFLGYRAKCFQLGKHTTAVAFACRMAIFPPAHNPVDDFVQIHMYLEELYRFLFPDIFSECEEWTRQQILDHMTDAGKKRIIKESWDEIDSGLQMPFEKLTTAKSFAKLEKHFETEIDQEELTQIPKTKCIPRLINSFHPQLNAILTVYTTPMSKLLNKVFHPESNILYAAGCPPSDINKWMNRAIQHSKLILEDDVSMSDGSHSPGSFMLTGAIRRANFPRMNPFIVKILNAITNCNLKKENLQCYIEDVNNSGVPLTSHQNTAEFVIVRIYAFCIAYRVDIEDRPMVQMLTSSLYMAISGDDGKTFCPVEFNGVRTFEPGFLERYSNAWAECGFSVPRNKIRIFDETNWRLSTFLAMRPVWSGEQYEYGPEIARRIKSMFWMLDATHHPVSWARGVCTGVLAAGKHVPVLSDICEWYLHVTAGSANLQAAWTHVYNPFHNYSSIGAKTVRGITEFLEDYKITPVEYQNFRDLLLVTEDPFVNIVHPVLVKIFLHE